MLEIALEAVNILPVILSLSMIVINMPGCCRKVTLCY